MKIIDNINNRFSPTSFSEKEIEEGDLKMLFSAGGKAASCFNEQPWRFVYAIKQDEKEFNLLLDCLVKGNQEWAKNAAALIITAVKKEFTYNGKKNNHARHDLGLAVGTLSIQAMEMNIYLHQMAGFIAEKAINNLNIPDGYEPVTAIALGYLGADVDKVTSIKERKKIEEVAFKGSWK